MLARLRLLLRIVGKHLAVAGFVCLWIVTHLLPRDERLWVFSAHDGTAFEGNPKYLFLHAVHQQDAVDPVWIGNSEITASLRDAGLPAYDRHSLRGMYTMLRAGVVFGSHYIDVPWAYTGGATVVQLWHGNGIKKLGRLTQRDDLSPFSRLLPRYVLWNWEYVVTTSPDEPAERMLECFSVDRRNVLSTGYPRTDILFETVPDYNIAPETDIYDEIASLAADRTVVSYIPTFRRHAGGAYGTPVSEAVDFERLNDVCAAADAELLVKLHPQENSDPRIDDHDHVRLLPRELDLMPLLKQTDVLLTDYSSTYMDFLLLDRPIVFYAYDRDSYLQSQELYFEYDDVTPGPVVDSEAELLETLTAVLAGEDSYQQSRAAVRNRFHQHIDGNASQRVYETVASAVGATDETATPSLISRVLRRPARSILNWP